MRTEYVKEIPAIQRKGRKFGATTQAVLDFLETDEKCLVFHCEDKQERLRVYNTLYTNTIRRYKVPIKRFVRGNDVYVIKDIDNE